MRPRLLLVAATLACIGTSDVRLSACSCTGPLPPCQAAWYSPIVFAGQVTSIEDVARPAPRPEESLSSSRRVTFRVTEVLRGDLTDIVVVHTGRGGGDCGYAFQEGRSYLVYTHRSPGGLLTTTICSRTRRVEQAAEDLAYLRGPARQPSALGTIFGVARMPDPWKEYASFERSPPYAGGRVVIEPVEPESAARYETVTGRDGRYSIEVPAGRYRAALHVRDGLYATAWGTPEILDTRGCGVTNFTVRPDGRIAGRVLAGNGQPVPALSVELLPADSVSRDYYRSSTRVRTDETSSFEFTRLAPGVYLLGLTLRYEGRRAESTAVWLSPEPGGPPVRVEIGPEERTTLGDLHLPASVPLARITGLVRDADGGPVRGADVYVLTSPRFDIAAGPIRADAGGAFAFTVIAGRTYRLIAERAEAPGQIRRAESDPFTAGPDLHPFLLQMPAR